MILKLNNIDVDCVIGERPDERTRTQRLRVDVELAFGDRAAETDHLDDTVDYAAMAERIRAALVSAKCQMIERAAKIAVEACLTDQKVVHAKATITKFGAIAHLESASVVFESKKPSGYDHLS